MNYAKVGAGVLCAACFVAQAQAADLSRGDIKFMNKAARAGMFEIEASQVAQQRSSDPEVKAFAEMMIADHTKAAAALKALATSKGVNLPSEVSRGQRKDIDKLKKKSGHDFDDEYADEVADDAHEDAVELFEDASKDAKDADVKAFAAQTLPTLQHHWEKGKALEKAVDKKG